MNRCRRAAEKDKKDGRRDETKHAGEQRIEFQQRFQEWFQQRSEAFLVEPASVGWTEVFPAQEGLQVLHGED
jgi:hypothetical protein